MDEVELVGGVLYNAADPMAAARSLAELLSSPGSDYARAQELGFEPSLVRSLRQELPRDPAKVEVACLCGASWVLGRRSSPHLDSWDPVASLPHDIPLPTGLRRTTGETLIGLISEAKRYVRFAAPYVDQGGIEVIAQAIAAATLRGIDVELFEPTTWRPGIYAIGVLLQSVGREGRLDNLRVVHLKTDAPFAHLKVVIVDGLMAYIGSANITSAGLVGRNLEVGVVVRGAQVAVVDRILDLFIDMA